LQFLLQSYSYVTRKAIKNLPFDEKSDPLDYPPFTPGLLALRNSANAIEKLSVWKTNERGIIRSSVLVVLAYEDAACRLVVAEPAAAP
jgi:hypothetical protein